MLRYLFITLFLFFSCQSPKPYDVLITNGRVIDGSGGPSYTIDVAILGDTIAAMGNLKGKKALKIIDASGKVVSPGFIDAHTHAIRGIYDVPTAAPFILQGVTTLTDGNDGTSPFPIGTHYEKIEATTIAPNWAVFVGQGTVRKAVMGLENRAPTDAELKQMKALTQQAMEEGALGLSTGLFYVPGSFSTTEEIIALAQVAGTYGGSYISHMRDEAAAIEASVAETIAIGTAAQLPVQITHHKVIGKSNWGLSKKTLQQVDDAVAKGQEVYIDQYPYTASQTSLNALIPQWAQAGGRNALLARLDNSKTRARIKKEVIQRILYDRGGGHPKNIFISECTWAPEKEGKNLAQLLEDKNLPPTPENAADLVFELLRGGFVRAVYHAISEEDITTIMQHPLAAIASDGPLMEFGVGKPHPRSYGTFARVLGKYVAQDSIISLETAIRKMTSLPAKALSIEKRGLLTQGYYADIAIFDPATIIDHATFKNPHQYATGVDHVFVNGTAVVAEGKPTELRPGRVLRGPGFTKN